ncbi:MAG: PEGA domain-containing protein [Deltaproteobacteria bacterium]|nr:PEGA domain-containing protein [Deltaproteobacteria bacterium]
MKKIFIVFLILFSTDLLAQEKGRLGLLNIRSSNIDRSLLNAIDKNIRHELISSNRYILITQEDMQKSLGFSPVEAFENCKSDIMCISQLGDLVKVYWLLSISLMKEKGNVILRGILYNIPNARIDLRLLKSFKMNENLVKDIGIYVEEALKKIGTGSINVNAPEDFHVYIDGNYYSNAPIIVDGLASGIHKVRIKKGDKDCAVFEVNVTASEISEINLDKCDEMQGAFLESTPKITTEKIHKFYEEPSFIISSSTAVMFLSTGIVLGILSKSDESKVKNAKCSDIANRDSLCEQINAKKILDSADTKAKAANVSFGLAGASALTAIGLGVHYYLKNKNISSAIILDGSSISFILEY